MSFACHARRPFPMPSAYCERNTLQRRIEGSELVVMAHRLRSVFAVSCTLRHVIKLEALAHRLIHARIVRYLPHLFWPVQLCKPSATSGSQTGTCAT
jgi:hypothetical protein